MNDLHFTDDGFPYTPPSAAQQEKFKSYAKAQLSLEEILLILNLTEDEATKNFKFNRPTLMDYYLALRAEGKAELVTAQYEKGVSNGNTALLLHLGTHWANQVKDSAASVPSISIIDDSFHQELNP